MKQYHYEFKWKNICESCQSFDWPVSEFNKIELPKHHIKIEISETPTDAIIEKFDITHGRKSLGQIYVKVHKLA